MDIACLSAAWLQCTSSWDARKSTALAMAYHGVSYVVGHGIPWNSILCGSIPMHLCIHVYLYRLFYSCLYIYMYI